MGFWKSNTFALVIVALAAAGCGDDEGSGGMGGDGGSGAMGGTGGAGGSPMGTGSATLTIGGETWEFDSFQCAFGYDATQSERYSFSSNAIQSIDGVRLQMQADIEDDSGEERYEGEGVIYTVTIQDVDDFENPSVDWEARGPADAIVVQIDGDKVTAEGVFDDLNTPEIEEADGTLDATCGAGSIR